MPGIIDVQTHSDDVGDLGANTIPSLDVTIAVMGMAAVESAESAQRSASSRASESLYLDTRWWP